MKIALACVPVVNGNIEHNSTCILQAMEACAGKADLVVFGESVLCRSRSGLLCRRRRSVFQKRLDSVRNPCRKK